MPEKMTRRGFIKKTVGTILAAAGSTIGGYFYARNVEPRMLDSTRHIVKSPIFPFAFNGLKIVQFSDTHIGFQYDMNQLEKLISKINKLKPDVIFFTGDLLDDPLHFIDKSHLISQLSLLDAPLGKFAVYGNHDHGGYGSNLYKDIIEQSGFTLLLNDAVKIARKESAIWIAGVDDAMLGKPDLAAAISPVPEGAYTILLSHAPDLADAASAYPYHLQLSGHSHGGQIQIPFFGPLVTPPFAEKYVEGFYSIGEQESLQLYVNRGLGTTRLPFRFLSQPELAIFTLYNEKTSS